MSGLRARLGCRSMAARGNDGSDRIFRSRPGSTWSYIPWTLELLRFRDSSRRPPDHRSWLVRIGAQTRRASMSARSARTGQDVGDPGGSSSDGSHGSGAPDATDVVHV